MEVAKVNGEEEEEVMPPPGFRFHPTDEELVGFYLQRKVEKKPLPIELIKQIDIYKYDPWDLPKVSCVGETEGYFFCRRGRKYRNSMRPNRVSGSGSGFWKATGIDKAIYGGGGVRSEQARLSIIGLKKSLVYYRGSAGKGTKTDWMMHEFRLPPTNNNTTIPNIQEAEVWTLCRIFKRIPAYKKYTPTFKETAAAAKPNPTHSTSKTCSSETDNGKPYLTFKDSLIIQQNDEIKNQIMNIEQVECERNHLFLGQFGPGAQATPPTLSYPRFWNPNAVEDVFADGNWDELGPVVQFAIDQSKVYYDCTEYFGEILS